MKDIILQLGRIIEERNIPRGEEYFDQYVQAMNAANERLDTECGTGGQVLSQPERDATLKDYFRAEATTLGMTPTEIEGRWCLHCETRRILDRAMVADAWNAAIKTLNAERSISGKPPSGPEHDAAFEKFFRIEAAKSKMSTAQIDDHWSAYRKTRKITERTLADGSEIPEIVYPL